MNKQTILQVDTQGKSPTLNYPQEPPPQKQPQIIRPDRPDCGSVSQGENASARFSRNGEEVVGNELKLNPGASNAERQLAPLTSEDYTLPEIDSSQTRAMMQTLYELRGLRDELLRQDECSAAGLLLTQITLVFERIQHGVHSGRETFTAALRAAQFTEPIHEAVEA